MQYGEAICLLCGFVIGEIKDGRFRHHAGCERPLRQAGRLPRCCRCGGSLYVDPSLSTPRYAGMAGLGAVAGWDE